MTDTPDSPEDTQTEKTSLEESTEDQSIEAQDRKAKGTEVVAKSDADSPSAVVEKVDAPVEKTQPKRRRGRWALKPLFGLLILTGWTVGFVSAVFWLFSVHETELVYRGAPLRDRVLIWIPGRNGPEIQLLTPNKAGEILGSVSLAIPPLSQRVEDSTVKEDRSWYEDGTPSFRPAFDILGSKMLIGMTKSWKDPKNLPKVTWVGTNALGWTLFSFGLQPDFLYGGKDLDEKGAYLGNVDLMLAGIQRFKLGQTLEISGYSESFAVTSPEEQSVAVFRLDLKAINPKIYFGPARFDERVEVTMWGTGRMTFRRIVQ